ncbi:MAG TPA: TIGR00730 family Rossman fold protein [Bryobacteraceae bacterium]|nr:TIGR00730 family Rossman fold protein [Bryobacteraceae bacterium]
MDSICVYCGSNPGFDPAFLAAAVSLGTAMGNRGLRLVYGGSHLGMMGALADAVLAAGGRVTGVVPRLLIEKEAAYLALEDLHIVDSMHERKMRMADLAGGFVSLPGGFGTLDETFEIATWAQLGIHAKPVVLWNVNGFYDNLFAFLDQIVTAGLLRPQHRQLVREARTLEEVFQRLAEPVEAGGGKWMPGDLR